MRSFLSRLPRWLALGLGGAAVIVAVLGGPLGLDSDQKWGEVRILALGAGLVVLGLAGGDRILTILDGLLLERKQRRPAGDPLSEGTPRRAEIAPRAGVHLHSLAPVLGFFLILYFGLATVWNWTSWPSRSYQYHQLTEAFVKGDVALGIMPPPELAELDNPYDHTQRQGIQVVGDLSYFNGRYYMYWGPTPAVLSAPWFRVFGRPVSDDLIVLLAVGVVFLMSAVLVLRIHREYFPRVPTWLALGTVVLVGTTHPLLWTVNSPGVYTAAISAGQACFVGGMSFLVAAIVRPTNSTWRWVICGVLWALAIGARITLLVPVGALIAAASALLVWQRSRLGDGGIAFKQLAGLVLPIVAGLSLLGLYNYVRFGDILETGFRYQLVPGNQEEILRRGLMFNPRFLLPNLLYYLVVPIRVTPEFPFLRLWWRVYPPFADFLKRFNLPALYGGIQDAAGLVFAAPVLLLGVWLLGSLVPGSEGPREWVVGRRGRLPHSPPLWVIVSLIGVAVLFLSGPTLFYRFAATRFLLEITPTLAILSAIGAFVLYQSAQGLPARRIAVTALIVTAIIVSALTGLILALDGEAARFDDANPALYSILTGFFAR